MKKIGTLEIVEKQDVVNLFEKLFAWEQREFIIESILKQEVFNNKDEALNYFGYSVPSLSDYSAYEIVDAFYADDLLSEMSCNDISDYVNSNWGILDDILQDAGIDTILSHFKFTDVVETYMSSKEENVNKFLDYIAKTYKEKFTKWLQTIDYIKPKDSEKTNNLDIKEENK